jgi:phosphoribosylanthranilate isomerase
MVQIKICGITNLADALQAVDAGANALGFNFYRLSPRFVEPEVVRSIVQQLPLDVLTVGVFVNEAEPETVARTASKAGVAAVQLHGEESPDYCRALQGRFVIKALQVGSGYKPEQAVRYPVDAILLAAFDPVARGGTGRTCDWTLARRTRELVPKLFLAGGLSGKNVAEAIAIVDPYGVDASSGLEIAPGLKDIARVRAFVAAAHL